MSTLVMSGLYPPFCEALRQKGHSIIESDTVEIFQKPEQKHADMQVLPVKDKLFILKECAGLKEKLPEARLIFCQDRAGKKYPENILLNFLLLNNKLYGKLSAIDKNLLSYCQNHGIITVNVNQGYARCSTLVITDNAVITSDKSIEKAMRKHGVEALPITSGHIALDGFNYGFIGGCSGKIHNTIYFFGNVKKHPDFTKIRTFIEANNSKLEILCEELPLTDIGGMVKID